MALKTDPKYGFYPWWPEDGDDWLHPEDVHQARDLIPSPRVFRRDGTHGPFVVLHYGDVRLRVKRTLWQELPAAEYDIGAWVEVLSRGQRNTPRTGVIRDIQWEPRLHEMRYLISEQGVPIEKLYAAEDLRPVEPTVEREEVIVTPPADDADADLL
jgi:hypothetical protein